MQCLKKIASRFNLQYIRYLQAPKYSQKVVEKHCSQSTICTSKIAHDFLSVDMSSIRLTHNLRVAGENSKTAILNTKCFRYFHFNV